MSNEGLGENSERKPILKLSKEVSEDAKRRLDWGEWRKNLQERVRKGDINGAANLLACSFDGERRPDEEERKKMFTDERLKGLHEKLWGLIKPEITPRFVDEIYQKLVDEYGWDI